VPYRSLSFLLILTFALPAHAQDRPHAFVGARILPIGSEDIEVGTLVVERGRIAAVGATATVSVPDGAVVVEAKGKVILPGLICTHSHIGGIGGADASGPIQPEVRVSDSIDVLDPGFRRAVAGGLTTINVMPGSGHLISGQTIYLKLRGGSKIEDLMIPLDSGRPAGGLKMANGTNSMKGPPFPGTRAKSAALVRQRFVAAEEYRAAITRAAGDPAKLPARDLALEPLVEALEGRRVVHHHTHRHDDIVSVLRLATDFHLSVVLHHVSDGWKIADEIAAAKVPCSVIVIDSPGGKLEAMDLSFETGSILEKAGVEVAFHTDDWITDSRLFLRSPALAVRAGMSRAGALRAVTIAGARMLGLADRIGTLEVGKDADFVILSGDPLSVYTKVLETWVEGEKVFDSSLDTDRLWAVGGYGAGNGRRPYLCCEDDHR
jgi:imidazolonepropionase-like amidohydrolase